jgi:hypothetical protein
MMFVALTVSKEMLSNSWPDQVGDDLAAADVAMWFALNSPVFIAPARNAKK